MMTISISSLHPSYFVIHMALTSAWRSCDLALLPTPSPPTTDYIITRNDTIPQSFPGRNTSKFSSSPNLLLNSVTIPDSPRRASTSWPPLPWGLAPITEDPPRGIDLHRVEFYGGARCGTGEGLYFVVGAWSFILPRYTHNILVLSRRGFIVRLRSMMQFLRKFAIFNPTYAIITAVHLRHLH